MVTKVLVQMVDYFGTDIRRINHALKVYSYTSLIAREEGLSDMELEITEIAAVLHDIGIPVAEQKYLSSDGKYQEIEGPPIAREILENLGVSSEIIDRVCFLIGNHHTYTKIDGVDFQILVEADFLVNIDEDKMSLNAVQRVLTKYFKTKTGIQLINRMYLFNL